MRTTNLYKVTHYDPEGWGSITKGCWEELHVGADTFDDVLRILKRKEIEDVNIQSIEFIHRNVVWEPDDSTLEWTGIA